MLHAGDYGGDDVEVEAVLRECPTCREPVSFFRSTRTAWGQFRCNVCGSVLGVYVTRRILAMVPMIGGFLLLSEVVHIQTYGVWVMIPSCTGVCLAMLYLSERVRMIERRAFCCRTCGYDLEGLTVPRCPECGAGFDPAEKAKILARLNLPPRKDYRWAVVGLVLVMSTLLAGGAVFLRRTRGKRTPVPTAGTVPAVPTSQDDDAGIATERRNR